jgi:hypothetical protein
VVHSTDHSTDRTGNSNEANSDPFQGIRLKGVGVVDVAGVPSGDGFKKHDAAFVGGDRLVIHAVGDDAEIAFTEDQYLVTTCLSRFLACRARFAVVHFKRTCENKKHFVFLFVVMPDVFALKLDEFDVLAVQLADDLGGPVVGEGGEFRGEVDELNRILSSRIPLIFPPPLLCFIE